jgi:hypothetical protein
MLIQVNLKAPKGKNNDFGHYKYRSCEDILESLKPLLRDVKGTVTFSDRVELIGTRFYIYSTAIFTDIESGDKMESTSLAREDDTKKGMDLAQISGSVGSYARKYALSGLFAIDNNLDPDASSLPIFPMITEEQINEIGPLAKRAGYVKETFAVKIKNTFNKTGVKQLTEEEATKFITIFKKEILDMNAKEVAAGQTQTHVTK